MAAEDPIPLLEWCVFKEALEWITLQKPPIDRTAFIGRHGFVYPTGQAAPENLKEMELEGNKKLFSLARAGSLKLRGYPAKGFRGAVIKDGYLRIFHDRINDDVEIISQQELIETKDLWESGWIYSNKNPPLGWAYRFVEVNVRDLITHFPPPPGQLFSVNGEPIFSAEPAQQPRPPLRRQPEAASTKRVPQQPIPQHDHPNRRLRTPEAAAYLGLSKSTLEKYRLTGEGPRFAKLGRTCTYSRADLDAWIEARTRNSTSEPA